MCASGKVNPMYLIAQSTQRLRDYEMKRYANEIFIFMKFWKFLEQSQWSKSFSRLLKLPWGTIDKTSSSWKRWSIITYKQKNQKHIWIFALKVNFIVNHISQLIWIFVLKIILERILLFYTKLPWALSREENSIIYP